MRQLEVIVLDEEHRFLEYTNPAIARKLLNEGKAVIYSKEPFAIQLNRSVATPNRTIRDSNNMPVINFTEFFKAERDIYVQNISNCQVSVSFEVGPGHTESFLFTNSKDPVNLTRHIPFAAIKSSMDLRKMLNRIPPALQIVTDEEYAAYFGKSAKVNGLKSVAEAVDLAERKRDAAQKHQPLANAPAPIKIHDVVEDDPHLGGKKIVKSSEVVSAEEEINPRVLHLCLQVHQSVPDANKMSAQELLTEIDALNNLKMLDWEYIQSHGYYKSVKNLARKHLAELAMSETVDDTDEVIKPAKAKKAKKADSTTTPTE